MGCYGGTVVTSTTTTGTGGERGTGTGAGGAGGTTRPRGQDGDVMMDAPAVIVVSLPADAALTVDGNMTKSVGQTRRLVTPSLPVGQAFAYTLEAKAGDMVATQKIAVRRGDS